MNREELIESMKSIKISTLEGNFSLYHMCYNVGVESVVHYWNNVEKKLPKDQRTMNNTFEVKKIIHKHGLIFKNGFEISKVEKRISKLFDDYPIIEKRERI